MSVKGWLLSIVWLFIFVIISWLMIRFWWVIFLVIPAISLIRGWLWRRKIKKAMADRIKNVKREQHQDERYCEAEFEILEDADE